MVETQETFVQCFSLRIMRDKRRHKIVYLVGLRAPMHILLLRIFMNFLQRNCNSKWENYAI